MSAPVDIRPQDLAIVQSILAEALPASARIYVFGSRATWATRDSSDLDLAIDAGRALTSTESAAMASAFEESDLPFTVDCVDLHTVSARFKAIIEQTKVPLPVRDSGATKRELVPLKQLLSKVIDNRGKTCPIAEVGLPLIATNCIKNDGLYPVFERVRYVSDETYSEWFRGHPEPGDLIFVLKGSPGQVCLTPDPVNFCIAQDMVALRADQSAIYPPYLFAVLRSQQMQDAIGNMHVGTMIPHFKKGDFDKLLVPVPDRDTQQYIGDTYLLLSQKIELNRRMNETLEGMARALFKDWFVDFGPVRAKANGGAPYLSDDLWALFPDRLSDDGLPEGWEMGTMGDEFDITMGQSPPGDTYNDEGVGLPFFQGRTDFGFRYPTNRKFCSNPSRLANAGDTLISVRAPVGDLNMAIEVCCIGRGVAAARHKTGVRGFTAYAMHSIQPELQMFENSGTVFGAINKVQFEKLKIVAPPTDIVAAFEAQVIEVDELIRNNTEQNYTLAATRDLLLPKLMSGALRVADATRVLEDAL